MLPQGPSHSPAPTSQRVVPASGNLRHIHVKVSTQDSGGALFMTEQPIERRGSGPPKHYHEEQDEWFYCLDGQYVVEIGAQRFRLVHRLYGIVNVGPPLKL